MIPPYEIAVILYGITSGEMGRVQCRHDLPELQVDEVVLDPIGIDR